MMLLRQQLRQRRGKKDFDSRAEKLRKTSRSGGVTRSLTGRGHLLSRNVRTPFPSKQWGPKGCSFDTLFGNNFKLWRILSPIQAAPYHFHQIPQFLAFENMMPHHPAPCGIYSLNREAPPYHPHTVLTAGNSVDTATR